MGFQQAENEAEIPGAGTGGRKWYSRASNGGPPNTLSRVTANRASMLYHVQNCI